VPIASEAPVDGRALVSVIVTAFNAEPWIERVVDSVRQQSYDRVEIVVIDDGSTDRTRELVSTLGEEDRRVTLAACEHAGTAKALTAGLRRARGEFVCLLSHDCYAVPDWLDRVVDALSADPSVGIVRGPVLPARESEVPFYHCMVVDHDSRSFDGVCIAYRAAALDAAGRHFDEQLSRYGDDADLGWRILECGYRHVWLHDPTAYHEVVPRTFWSGIRTSLGVYRFALLVRRHPDLRARLGLRFLWGGRTRYASVVLVHVAAIALVAGQPQVAAGAAAGLVGVLLADGARRKAATGLTLRDRWLAMPLERLLSGLVATYALAYGSLRYRSLVL